tara:strand:- start:187 stop:1152 length:966 start_codon:yes stop_codon:yes gene_type:complete
MNPENKTGALQFTLTAADGRKFLLELQQGQVALAGRDLGAEIVIPDGRVSRHHASLSLAPAGLYIEDLHSQNGTLVNSEKILRGRLDHGDSINLGGYEFVLGITGEPETLAVGPGKPSPAVVEALASLTTKLPSESSAEDLDLCLERLAGRLDAVFLAAFRVDHGTMTAKRLACLDLSGDGEAGKPATDRKLPGDFLDRVMETGKAEWLRVKEGAGGTRGATAVAAAPAIIDKVVGGLLYLERKDSFSPLDLEILSAFTTHLGGAFTGREKEAASPPARGFYKRLGEGETVLPRSGVIRSEGSVAEVAENLVDTVGDQADL